MTAPNVAADGQRMDADFAVTVPGPPADDGIDNVAYFGPTDDNKSAPAAVKSAVQNVSALDRHQLPPSALAPAQFEMNYGMPPATTANNDGISSKENLLTPRGESSWWP